MKNRVALVPSYEPTLVLLDVVKELLENDFNVVVVNDGSDKKFDKIFNELPKKVHYLAYDTNMGKGHALKHGMSYIRDHFEDVIVITMDSDGQHKVSDAIKVCDRCEQEPGSIVIGSRHFDKKTTPFRSRFGNFMARMSFLISTHHKIYDTQTGLRAFDSSLLGPMMEINGNRYEYEMNVLLEAIKSNIPIIEERIETIYINDNSGTHYNPFKDTLKIVKELIKFSASSFIGFLVDYAVFTLLSFVPVTWTYWLEASNVIARIISASVNFTLNYKVVFKSKANVFLAILKYTLLALFILGCGTLLISVLVKQAGMNEYLAKVLVEVTMFIVSWTIQRLFVFRKRQKK